MGGTGMTPIALVLEEFRDVLALPGHQGLFSADGRLIEGTVHVRRGVTVRRPPDVIDVPRDLVTLDRPVVYVGHLPKRHFGHFILEGLSRFWGLTDPSTEGLEVLHHRKVFEAYEHDLMRPLLGSVDRLRRVDQPLLLREALVPSQGVVLGRPIAPGMVDVYDRVRDAIGGSPVRANGRPVYLSRTRLPGHLRRTLGEAALEQRLLRRGFDVVHPQELSLEEQLRTVSSAATVVGLEGSALHLTIFRGLADARTVTLNPLSQEPNQAAIDVFRGAQSIHIHAQFPLHVRVPRFRQGPVLALGPYRNFLVPRIVERRILAQV
jgi:capsular polysaccharide biosynthesis protein